MWHILLFDRIHMYVYVYIVYYSFHKSYVDNHSSFFSSAINCWHIWKPGDESNIHKITKESERERVGKRESREDIDS